MELGVLGLDEGLCFCFCRFFWSLVRLGDLNQAGLEADELVGHCAPLGLWVFHFSE
jgi:hypothetical protein